VAWCSSSIAMHTWLSDPRAVVLDVTQYIKFSSCLRSSVFC
jgi:hypothetical protein